MRWMALAAAALAAVVLAACGSSDEPKDSVDFSTEAVNRQTEVRPVLLNSELAARGPERISIGLYADDGRLVHNAEATLSLYRLDGDRGEFLHQIDLSPVSLQSEHQHGADGAGTGHDHDEDPLVTVYVASVEFEAPGRYGFVIDATASGERMRDMRGKFRVTPDPQGPVIGGEVPATVQQTLQDVDAIEEICTAQHPRPELHDRTIAEALQSGKPVLIALATPRFCQTRFCGPMLEQVAFPVADRYGDEIEVVHVEPFDVQRAMQGELVPGVMIEEWGLRTEPWIFVLAADGTLAAEFEGVASVEEIGLVIDRLLGG